ncbi:transposase, partial [Sulfobacillus sp. DSM 109850]|nr:transposase [Sulfobacillus harzensis]
MFPIVRSHPAYQAFVQAQLRRHYAPGALQFVAPDWALVAKFWRTDLSDTARLLHETFSLRGPRPWDPADLLRSYLLMLEVGEPSITRWVQQLQRCPLYAVLSGFEYGHTPGVGTFYGF